MSALKRPMPIASIAGIALLVMLLFVTLWPDRRGNELPLVIREEVADSLPVTPAVDSGEATIEQVAKGQEYIQLVLPVLSRWNADELTPFLSAATLEGTDQAALSEVLSVLASSLGKLVNFAQPEFVEVATEDFDSAQQLLLAYQFTGVYEQGEAEVYLVVQERLGEYFLYAFNISLI